jgi:DNA-binding transcriptional MerR regulator
MPQKADKHSPEFNDGQRLYTMKQLLLRSAAREYREKWFSNAHVTEAKRQLEHEHEHDDDDDNSPRSVETFTLT